MPFCTACGNELSGDSSFCSRCGRPLRPAATATPHEPIPENIAGVLAYFFIPAIVFLLVEPYKQSRFIRFHCWQALVFYGIWAVVHAIVALPVIAFFALPFLELAFFAIWVVLLIKAFQGELFKLPEIGNWAEQQANR